MYESELAQTGASALIVGGLVVSQWSLMGAAVATVIVAAGLARYGWRRGKAVTAR